LLTKEEIVFLRNLSDWQDLNNNTVVLIRGIRETGALMCLS
jgi:hypothetical protein